MIPYEDRTLGPLELPPRQDDTGYIRPPIGEQTFVPNNYADTVEPEEPEIV